LDLSLRFDPMMRRVVAGVLLAGAAVLSKVAAQRLELLHRRPDDSFPYFAAFGLTLLLSLIAGLIAPARLAVAVEARAPSRLRGRVRFLLYAAAIGTVVLFGWAWIRQGRVESPLPTLAVWASALALGTVAFGIAGRGIVPEPRRGVSPGILAALLVVLIAAACARLIGLEAVPPVFGGDEAEEVMDGTSLIREDFSAEPFGTGWIGTGRLGMLPAGAGALLSKDPVAGPRLLYAVAGVLSVAACAAAAGLVAGGWGALGCAALLAFSPHHVHFSRLAAVFILDAFLAGLAVLLLLAAHRTGSPVCGYLAGVSAALSLYGYAGGRVIAVSFVVALPLLYFVSPVSRGKRLWLLFAAATGFALTAAPGLRFAFQHSIDWNSRLNQVGILNPLWWGAEVSHLGSPAKVIGGQFVSGTIGLLSQQTFSECYLGYPILSPVVLPALALAGLGWMVGRRQFFPVALLALIALGNLANLMLTVPTPAPQRPSSLVPMLAILGGVAMAGFLELVPSRDEEGIPWRGTVGALLIGGLLVRTYGGPPRYWDASPGYGGSHGAFVQSAYEALRSPRYHGEKVILHGLPYLDSYFPTLRYFLPQIRWVDAETQHQEQSPPAPGLHLFAPEWLPAARQWRARFRIPFGFALPDPGDPLHDVGYLFRGVSPPARPFPPANRGPHRSRRDKGR
jgi:hypothetical protein